MKGKYFFVEHRKEIEIQEFDYAYVLNSLAKEFSRREVREYCYTVVVKRTYDSLGQPNYDVRTLNLNEIYYDNRDLCILELMKDQICFKDVRIQDLPMPPLQREYMDWKEGRSKPVIVPVKVDIPPVPVRQRVEIAEDDVRLEEIANMGKTDLVPMEVLDWVVNMPIRAHEVGTNIQKISEQQLDLSGVLIQHSDYMNSLYNNLTNVLEEIFPLKPTFKQKLFGKTDIKVSSADLPKVLQSLQNAVKYDTTKFAGVQSYFDNISESLKSISTDITQGLGGCEFQIAKIEDTFELELMKERLTKMSIVNDMTETDLIGMNKSFMIDMNRMKDIQTLTIPLIIMRLRNQTDKVVDNDTADIIRNLAYGMRKK